MGSRLIATAVLLLLALALDAEAMELSGSVSAQGRLFWQEARDPGQEDHSLSVAFAPEVVQALGQGSSRLTFKPFLRLNRYDPERTHWDVRELAYLHYGDGWEIGLGFDKVFWGVTEVWHLVDIINQTDLVEDIDGEDKLGQPMLKLLLSRDWGSMQVFVLPWFRDRTFPGREGRLRNIPPVDTDLARFEAGNGRRHVDLAVRWSHFIGAWDLGLAHFRGTSREPTLIPGRDKRGRPVLIPYYELIDQTSLDAQYTKGSWLWKLEAIYRVGQTGGAYFATTGGFEYTWVGFRGGNADLGFLAEFMWDGRGDDAGSAYDHDLFAGLRWAGNDAQSSELLTGVIWDWESGSRTFNLEASRRLGRSWTLSVQARAWSNIANTDPLAAVSQDDYLEIELARYF